MNDAINKKLTFSFETLAVRQFDKDVFHATIGNRLGVLQLTSGEKLKEALGSISILISFYSWYFIWYMRVNNS